MTVESFIKRLRVWFVSHSNVPESLKMTLILDSLKDNKEREDLRRWVIYNIDDDDSFDLTMGGIFEDFIQRFKDKFQASNWEQSERVWQTLLEFKANQEEKTKEYIARFNEIESQMKNIANKVPDVFMASHLLNRASISEHSKQSILANIDLEDKKNVLKNVKKKMEQLLPKLNYEDPQMTLWNQRMFYGPLNKRGEFYRGDTHPNQGQDYPKGSLSGRSKSRDRELAAQILEAEQTSQSFRGRSRSQGRNQGWQERGRSRSQGRRDPSRGRSGRREPSRHRDVFTCEVEGVEEPHEVFFTENDNKAVLDSGCPKTVGGKHWLKLYVTSLKQTEKFKNFEPDEIPKE